MALQHVAGKNKGHIVLYALSTCPWCGKTKKLLKNWAWNTISAM